MISRRDQTSDRYSMMDNDGELHIHDEENINWSVLCLRLLAIVILVAICIAVALGTYFSKRLWYLAAVMTAAMIIVLFCSIFRFDRLTSRYVFRFGQHGDETKNSQSEITSTTTSSIYSGTRV